MRAPPSTSYTEPVMKPFDTSSAMVCATSSAVPMRATGSELLACSWKLRFCSGGIESHHGVSMTPGLTALTRTGASSSARIGTTASIAALTAAVLARHADKLEGDIDVCVDALFGAMWYRLLIGHAPLDAAFAKELAALATHGLGRRRP